MLLSVGLWKQWTRASSKVFASRMTMQLWDWGRSKTCDWFELATKNSRYLPTWKSREIWRHVGAPITTHTHTHTATAYPAGLDESLVPYAITTRFVTCFQSSCPQYSGGGGSGDVRVGNSGTKCTPANAGTLRYVPKKGLTVCDGKTFHYLKSLGGEWIT